MQGFQLGDEEAFVSQRVIAHLVEPILEEADGGTDRIGQVDEDGVELPVERTQGLEGVADHDGGAGVGERAVDLRVVLPADVDDLFVVLAQEHLLDRVVLQDRAHQMSVAAADDRNTLRVGVRHERRVSEELVVDVRVEVGLLDDAIEGEHPSEAR